MTLMGLCPGITEMYSWLRGFENYYLDLISDSEAVACFLDRLMQLKAAYWQHALELCHPYINAVNEVDDLGSQNALLVSPLIYRNVIKPRHRDLFSYIKKNRA